MRNEYNDSLLNALAEILESAGVDIDRETNVKAKKEQPKIEPRPRKTSFCGDDKCEKECKTEKTEKTEKPSHSFLTVQMDGKDYTTSRVMDTPLKDENGKKDDVNTIYALMHAAAKIVKEDLDLEQDDVMEEFVGAIAKVTQIALLNHILKI